MKVSNHLFYKNSFLKHGNSAKGLHWSSKVTQEKRFSIILDLIPDIEQSVIVDAGCGYGHILDYFKKQNSFPKNYIGIDCEDFMIELCNETYPKYNFTKLDILTNNLPIGDYYICSGAVNLLDKENLFLFIKNCFNSSKKGFIFNHISNNFYNISKDEVLNYCQTITNKFKVEENYLKNDYTIYLMK